MIYPTIAGASYSTAWWLFADGALHASKPFGFTEWLPCIVGTLAFILMQFCNPNRMRETSMMDDGAIMASKIIFFVSLLVGFLAICIGIILMLLRGDGDPWSYATIVIAPFCMVVRSVPPLPPFALLVAPPQYLL